MLFWKKINLFYDYYSMQWIISVSQWRHKLNRIFLSTFANFYWFRRQIFLHALDKTIAPSNIIRCTTLFTGEFKNKAIADCHWEISQWLRNRLPRRFEKPCIGTNSWKISHCQKWYTTTIIVPQLLPNKYTHTKSILNSNQCMKINSYATQT